MAVKDKDVMIIRCKYLLEKKADADTDGCQPADQSVEEYKKRRIDMVKKALAIVMASALTLGGPFTVMGSESDADSAAESAAEEETAQEEKQDLEGLITSLVSERPEEDLTIMLPENQYELTGSVEVNGRQGVCSEGDYYWVSGSTTLAKYDKDWNLIELNDDPFVGYELEVNHIADIDVYQNELYIGAEYFMDGVGKNIQIAVYDGDTLKLKRTFSFEPDSGQLECSGIAVDPDTKTVWMCSWVGEESGRYLYKYDLETGAYLGKVHMQMPPQWLQGIAYHDGCFYMTADDGTADDNEPDHLYRTRIEDGATNCIVTLERTFDDVTKQGEIEGLTFDEENGQLLLLYNRGARIVLGMPKGFYDGYDKEISEVFTYNLSEPEDIF